MGITFSFQQLILDNAIIDDIKAVTSQTKLPKNMNDPTFVRDLVASYKGQIPPVTPENFRSFWQGVENKDALEKKAGDIANEIINTHKVESLDRPTLNQMRRIVLSAE